MAAPEAVEGGAVRKGGGRFVLQRQSPLVFFSFFSWVCVMFDGRFLFFYRVLLGFYSVWRTFTDIHSFVIVLQKRICWRKFSAQYHYRPTKFIILNFISFMIMLE